MTCDQWRARLATLQAAELKALTGQVISVQDGEHRMGKGPIPVGALQESIAVAQRHVDRCDGCRPRGRAVIMMPVDY